MERVTAQQWILTITLRLPPAMNFRMTAVTESDEVLFDILAGMAAELLVVNFQMR